MANAAASGVKVYLNAESVWGTQVTTGAYGLRITGGAGKTSTDTMMSRELTNYENAAVTRTAVNGGGSYNFEFTYSTADKELDLILSSLFGAAWATNVLKVGTTLSSFSLEERFTDLTNTNRIYLGCLANSFRLDIRPGDMITGSFAFASKKETVGASVFTPVTAANTNAVMNPMDSIQALKWGGTTVPGVTAFSMELRRPSVVFGQLSNVDPAAIMMGSFEVSGSISMYLSDATYLTDYLGFTDRALQIVLGGAASKKYQFDFGACNFTDGGIESLSKDSPVIQTFNWAAKYYATDTTCKITRTP